MGVMYFKRYRMEIDLTGPVFSPPRLPLGYRLLPWSGVLLEAHARTKFRCFRTEIDANVFPCLGDREGCLRLMDEIARKDGFLREATWLAVYEDPAGPEAEYCGTIQGICDSEGLGSVQNVGVTPGHRGRGLGSALVHRALEGFRRVGARRAYLEVTAQNTGAIRLYRRLGFRRVRAVYKTVEMEYA